MQPEPAGEPGAGAARKGQPDVLQSLRGLLATPGIPAGQTRHLLDERHRGAARGEAEEPADQQLQHHPATADHDISDPPGVPAVNSDAALLAGRATGLDDPDVCFEHHGRRLHMDPVNGHVRQVRKNQSKIRSVHRQHSTHWIEPDLGAQLRRGRGHEILIDCWPTEASSYVDTVSSPTVTCTVTMKMALTATQHRQYPD